MSLDNSQQGMYKSSCVHYEYLTYCIENPDGKQFSVKMYIPAMYPYLVHELKRMYSKKQSNVHNIPIVQGYLFEEAFFLAKQLKTHPLSIKTLNINTRSPRTFKFSTLTPAAAQQTGAITSKLKPGYMYHLRSGHPAIDSVCVALTESEEKFLLLLQVSLSSYSEHLSKAVDIRRGVTKQERKSVEEILPQQSASTSIAQYYQYLGGNIDNDRVMYVYISPKEIDPPNDMTFLSEQRDHGTRSTGSNPPAYWYGFIDASMKEIIEMIKGTVA